MVAIFFLAFAVICAFIFGACAVLAAIGGAPFIAVAILTTSMLSAIVWALFTVRYNGWA